MNIEAVDFFYLSMPVVTDAGDGSQDALVVRVAAGGLIGLGRMRGVAADVDRRLCTADVARRLPAGARRRARQDDWTARPTSPRIAAAVELECMDLLQAAHTFSGIEMALWDLLGRKREAPVYELLGLSAAPIQNSLMPRSSSAIRRRRRSRGCRAARERGFRAVKCGWGPFGRGTPAEDRDQLQAAREGIGPDGTLLIDAGQIFREDVDAAAARIAMLEEVGATWLEEPFLGGAYDAYAALAARSGKVRLAGGEASHNFHMARQLIDYGKVAYIQIDCGRIGGIAPAKRVADYAVAPRRHLCQPHFHVASRALRVASALCRARGACHLRVSVRAEIGRLGHERDAPGARPERRGDASRRAGPRD